MNDYFKKDELWFVNEGVMDFLAKYPNDQMN